MSNDFPDKFENALNSQILDLINVNQVLANTVEGERRATDLLRQQQGQLQVSFDAAGLGTWRWDLVSGLVTGNSQMQVLYGLDPAQLVAKIDKYYECICVDDREDIRASLEDALSGGRPYAVEFRIVHPDGSDHWIAARGAVVRDAHGQPVAMMGINFDIDSRKKAEIALLESQRQFETLADSIPQLAWMANPDGFIFWYNARWYSYTGTTPEQMEGWGWKSVHDPRELPAVMEKWQASIASGERFEMEMPLRGNDGIFRWFLTRVTPVMNAHGEVVRWFGTNTDVTEIRQAREALRESEHQLRQLADTMPQLVCVTKPDGYIDWWNRRWYDYSGMTRADSTGIGWTKVMHPEDLEMTERAWLHALATGNTFEGEYRWRRHDGAYRWFLSRALPVRDATGEIIKWFATCTDIDDYKRADAEVRSLNEGLKERNEQLSVQTRRAEDANRAKSSFLAVMSHEIRTPMNAILGMSDLLSDSQLDPEQRQYVEVFRRAGHNLLSLINDILDLSKIEAGHFELEHSPFDIEDIADRSLELIGPKANAKGLSLMCRIAPGLQTSVVGDPGRLQQVLVNLLGNAVKFTECGEVVLHIEQRGSGEAGCLEMSVTDTGIGIAPDKHESIFNDFEQADGSTTRQYGGTGLGLGIARRLVQCMGGNISVESTLGKGSTFRFHVKLEPGIKTISVPRTELSDLLGRRILVVDNNATNRLILRETLTSWGLESAEYATADAGVLALMDGRLANRPFELAIVDRQMPDDDGFAVARLLRTVAPQIPVIMLSSDERSGDAARRRENGLSGFALRPVKRADLLRLLCKALGTVLERSPLASLGPSDKPTVDAQPGSLRILIAEDSADNRMLFQAYLKNSPHTLTFVENGRRAVDLFETEAYDLILMDMQMPVMDGLGATRAIRIIELAGSRKSTPVIAITANALPQDVVASRNAGCDAHLSKPISKERLLSAIAQYQKAQGPGQRPPPITIDVPEGLEELVSPYLAARKNDLPVLQQALVANEFERIRKLGHDLKGTGTSFGFPELTRMGSALEVYAKESSVPGLTRQLHELGQYLGRVELARRN